jgi:uncharacterized protein (TIGR03435 family)
MPGRSIVLGAVAAIAGAAAPATFDVASVKISKAPDAVIFFGNGMMDSANGRFRIPSIGGNVNINNWTLWLCITAAWDLDPGQLSGPSWLNSDRYDIAAKTSPAAASQITQADLRIMLQALLAERFKLATHREMKELSSYALVAAKSGPKLRASTGDQHLPVLFAPPARLIGQGSTMQGLALALSHAAGRPVVDKTGINGTFDFSLTYTRDDGADNEPSIFTALQEQLGLRLEPQKSEVEILVVDHAERVPTEN